MSVSIDELFRIKRSMFTINIGIYAFNILPIFLYSYSPIFHFHNWNVGDVNVAVLMHGMAIVKYMHVK